MRSSHIAGPGRLSDGARGREGGGVRHLTGKVTCLRGTGASTICSGPGDVRMENLRIPCL